MPETSLPITTVLEELIPIIIVPETTVLIITAVPETTIYVPSSEPTIISISTSQIVPTSLTTCISTELLIIHQMEL